MSLQTHRGQVRRKVHQREIPSVSSSILRVWTWANSLLSPPGQPFSLHTGQPFDSMHTRTETRSLTIDPTDHHELREIKVLVVAHRTSWFIVELVAKLSKRPEEADRGKPLYLNSREIYWPQAFGGKKNILLKWQTFEYSSMRIYLMFAWGNRCPSFVIKNF